MSKAFFIDTTVCTGCRGCQVACKQWHGLPAEQTVNRGGNQNPPDLSFSTYKLVRMTEVVVAGKLRWLFFPDQCRHCMEAPCLETASEPSAIYREEKTGAIIYTAHTKELDVDAVIESCPYNVPRKAADGTLGKCDMCQDRVHNGLAPACVKTCPSGAMNFGERKDMLALAERRLAVVKRSLPKALLVDADTVSVMYLVAYNPLLYAENAIAQTGSRGMSRHMAMKTMFRPLARALSTLG